MLSLGHHISLGHGSIPLTALPVSAMAPPQSMLHIARVSETQALPKPKLSLGSHYTFKIKSCKSLPWPTEPPCTGPGCLSALIFPHISFTLPFSSHNGSSCGPQHKYITASGPLHLLFLLCQVLFSPKYLHGFLLPCSIQGLPSANKFSGRPSLPLHTVVSLMGLCLYFPLFFLHIT